MDLKFFNRIDYKIECQQDYSKQGVECEDVEYIHIIKNGVSSRYISKFLSIQYCTTCMGRLCHIEKTLPENLHIVQKYPNQSIVLVDYHSEDGLYDYIVNHFKDEIWKGKLEYYKTEDYQYFRASHAKNCAHRLCSADILVNLDADNYLTDEFVKYILTIFSENINSVFQGCETDTMGRIAISKENFEKLGGYDESFVGYGEEDHDLVARSKMIGCEIRMKGGLCNWISHNDDLRVENQELKDKFQANERNMKRKFYNLGNNIVDPNTYHGISWGQCEFTKIMRRREDENSNWYTV